MTDRKGASAPGFQANSSESGESFFNRATPEELDDAADWMISKARLLTRFGILPSVHKTLCLGAVALVGIAAMRKRESGDG